MKPSSPCPDITHVKTVGRVQWTRYADGVWRSKFGQVWKEARRSWVFKPRRVGLFRHGYYTMRQAMHDAAIEG